MNINTAQNKCIQSHTTWMKSKGEPYWWCNNHRRMCKKSTCESTRLKHSNNSRDTDQENEDHEVQENVALEGQNMQEKMKFNS